MDKAYAKEYWQRPDVKARRKERRQTERYKENSKASSKRYRAANKDKVRKRWTSNEYKQSRRRRCANMTDWYIKKCYSLSSDVAQPIIKVHRNFLTLRRLLREIA